MHVVKQCCGPLLWMCLLSVAHFSRGCTLEDFKMKSYFDTNFDLSSLQASYAPGAVVKVPCHVGYRGTFKLICSERGWQKRGNACTPVTCGHPGDAQFAYFELVLGDDYVFGSQVLYKCQSGYQMASSTATRNCVQGGWDGHLPVCEPILCPELTVGDNVLVNGDMEQSRSGNVIQFRCINRGFELLGPAEIFCNEDGKWSDVVPTCREISCAIPQIDNIEVAGGKAIYRENEVLRYSCAKGYKRVDGRPSICKKSGQSPQWNPLPQCELITCKLRQIPPEGTTYNNQGKIIFKPGERVGVSCGKKRYIQSRENQTAELVCKETGEWDTDPECQMVQCEKVSDHVSQWGGYGSAVNIDEEVWYRCESDYEETSDSQSATCKRPGWQPEPLCKEKRCSKPFHKNAEIIDDSQLGKYEHEATVNFRCLHEPKTFSLYCDKGKWKSSGQSPQCREKPCKTEPSIKNAKMLEDNTKKTEYDHGDFLMFSCNGGTDDFRVTCLLGEWSPSKACADNCDVVNVSDSVTSAPASQLQSGQSLEFQCKKPEHVLQGEARVTCLENGQWSAPFPLCTDPSTCGSPPPLDDGDFIVSSGPPFDRNTRVEYQCKDKYTLQGASYKTCLNGVWTGDMKCLSPWTCLGSPPPLANGDFIVSSGPPFDHNTKVEYQCKDKYTLQGASHKTCLSGVWTGDMKCLKPCTVTAEMLEHNKIVFVKHWLTKVYAPHGDRITFTCKAGATHDGVLGMQQTCDDGEMSLPKCV